MKVTLRKQKISKGRNSLFLDITGQGRHKEYLKLYVFQKPKNYLDKKHNEETMRQAEDLRALRQLELQAESHGLEYKGTAKLTFNEFFQQFIDNYQNKDIKKFTSTFTHYKDFTGSAPLFLNQKFVDDFKKYLRDDTGLTGETPFTYFTRFKKVCLLAFKERVIKSDPSKLEWKLKFDRHALRKEVLTEKELRLLVATECGNEEVKKLFLFCCNTGLRFGDAKNLTWGKIKGMRIQIEQGKTGRFISQEINSSARRLIGSPGKDTDHVFNLKGIDGINKVIENWYKKAKLEKHITTHSARHTFCTMLMERGVDVKTIISLMGWSEGSGMRQIMRYSHLVDGSMKKAVDLLPEI